MGRICHDLELKTTQSETEVLSFRIAVDRGYQKQGEERAVDFFNIVAWRTTAEFISRYFDKGRMILVEGELQTRQYEDKHGVTVNVVELVANQARFTGEKKEQSVSGSNNSYQNQQAASQNNHQQNSFNHDYNEPDDDDYPF